MVKLNKVKGINTVWALKEFTENGLIKLVNLKNGV